MSRQNQSNILDGANESLQILWRKRDAALEYEKSQGIQPRTSDKFYKAQRELELYFNPIEPKPQRRKPKKKTYVPEDGWCY